MKTQPYKELQTIHSLLEDYALPLLAERPPRAIADTCPTLTLPGRASLAVELLQAAANAHEKRRVAAIEGQDFEVAAQIRDTGRSLRKLAGRLQQLKRPNKETLQAVVADLRRASADIGEDGRSTYP